MAALAWLLIPLVAAVGAAVWGSWAARNRKTGDVAELAGTPGSARPWRRSVRAGDEHRPSRRGRRRCRDGQGSPVRTAPAVR